MALGGGSTIGLAKAIALRTDLPQIAIPTTYAGSEMTPILGQTENGAEDHAALAEGTARDRDLRRRPDHVAAGRPVGHVRHQCHRAFGRGALCGRLQSDHQRACRAEHRGTRSLPASDRQAIRPTVRRAPMRSMAPSWPVPASVPSAWRCITSSATRSEAPSTCRMPRRTRSCCRTPLPTTRLPCRKAAADGCARSRCRQRAARPVCAGAAGRRATGALRDLGMPEDGIDRATDIALKNPYWNPRPLERDGIRALIAAAWAGDEPG